MRYKTACGTVNQLRNEFGEEEDDSSGEDDLSVAFPCIRGYFAGRGQAMAKKGASILASRGPWGAWEHTEQHFGLDSYSDSGWNVVFILIVCQAPWAKKLSLFMFVSRSHFPAICLS